MISESLCTDISISVLDSVSIPTPVPVVLTEFNIGDVILVQYPEFTEPLQQKVVQIFIIEQDSFLVLEATNEIKKN